MQINIHPRFLKNKSVLMTMIEKFDSSGVLFGDGKRNKIKLFDLDEKIVNIKSFKIPFFFNKIIYGYFKESKAKRSYEYALRLINYDIGTPFPIAFFENKSLFGLKNSYYVCEHIQYDFMFRDLIESENFPDIENILKQFTQFTFNLHQNGVEFLDHSPGNTLIKKLQEGKYDFYLVDLNRMKFRKTLSYDIRVSNLKRLTPFKEMIAVMSNEYASLYQVDKNLFFDKLWKETSDFQNKFYRKKRFKKFFKIG
jgi:hypothetical protein